MKKIKNIFQKLTERRELSYKEIKLFLDCIDKSKVTPSQIGAFLMGLKMKGLSINEIFYITKIMRMYARQIKPKVKKPLIDTCGTGGGIPTINISTAVAIVA
ncbi:MAG: anthranilate phosphoribosyltransferase, partial [Candidatus Aenigmarchaeota archaeon ex4484_224]